MTATAVALLTLAACGGPERPFELGLKEVPSDLLLGGKKKPLPLPAQLPPTATLTIDLPGGSAATPTTRLPPPIPEPPPPEEPCPKAEPLSAADRQVTPDIAQPPVPATYRYRTKGYLATASSVSQVLPTAVHTVANVQTIGPGEFTYDVTVVHGARTTTTTYHVVPRTSVAIPPGLYIAAVDTDQGDPFQPVPELRLLPFPALRGANFTAAGSDGTSTVSYEAVVTETRRVDACGAFVHGIGVRLINGRAASGTAGEEEALTETFEATYYIATQYGGVIVESEISGESGLGPSFSRSLTSLIAEVPK